MSRGSVARFGRHTNTMAVGHYIVNPVD